MEKHPEITKDEARRFLELIALGQQQCDEVLAITPFVVGYLAGMFEQTWGRRHEPGDARDVLKLIAERCYACGNPGQDTCPLCNRAVCRDCAEREGVTCCDSQLSTERMSDHRWAELSDIIESPGPTWSWFQIEEVANELDRARRSEKRLERELAQEKREDDSFTRAANDLTLMRKQRDLARLERNELAESLLRYCKAIETAGEAAGLTDLLKKADTPSDVQRAASLSLENHCLLKDLAASRDQVRVLREALAALRRFADAAPSPERVAVIDQALAATEPPSDVCAVCGKTNCDGCP